MAEKEEEVEAAAEEEEVKKPSKLKALLIPVLTSALTAALVGVALIFFMAPHPEPVSEEAGAETEAGAGHGAGSEGEHKSGGEQTTQHQEILTGGHSGIYHNYDPFIVSIFDREKVHYLKVVLSLELASEGVKEEINLRNPQVRDAMIFVLSDFTLRELLDNQSKNLLKEILIKTLNKILGEDKVLQIYFTEFTIQ